MSNYPLAGDQPGYPYTIPVGAGSEISGYIPKFVGHDAIRNSVIFEDSLNIGIGTITPTAKLDILVNETRGSTSYSTYNLTKEVYTILPSTSASASIYQSKSVSISVDANNTQNISSVKGCNTTLSLRGIGRISSANGVVSNIQNYAPGNTDIKSVWATVGNFNTISGFVYSLQADVSNWAYGGSLSGSGFGVGNITTVRAVRVRIQNENVFFTPAGEPSGPAHIDTAQLIYANCVNGYEGTRVPTYGGTITTLAGFHYDLTNNHASSVITNSYGIYLSTPVNSGTITNHYGIYLANQTVAGSTLNYAIYSAGGKVGFVGLPTSAAGLSTGDIWVDAANANVLKIV